MTTPKNQLKTHPAADRFADVISASLSMSTTGMADCRQPLLSVLPLDLPSPKPFLKGLGDSFYYSDKPAPLREVTVC